MAAIERVMDAVAQATGLDPLEVRRRNLYGGEGRNLTPYHQTVEDNVAPQLLAELAASCDYEARQREIETYNAHSPVLKKGLALTPVKFGISFTTTHLNQAGALIHLYADGSILLNHGGTEMGQGLFVKVAQIVAEAFKVDVSRVKVTSTVTDKVPNTSATAASSGADLNGMAALNAANAIKARLVAFAAKKWGCDEAEVAFTPGACGPGPSWSRSRCCAARPTWPGCRCRRPASMPRPRSTTTAPPIRAGHSTISPMARPAARC